VLERHDHALQGCVYCPKLCRAACPVANARGNEALTPWGKMSTAYFMARGDLPLTAERAAVAWACTTCGACRERCEHHNGVATVLADVRAEMWAHAVVPAVALRVASEATLRAADLARATGALQPHPPAAARVAVLLGCSYARKLPEVARDAMVVMSRLLDEPFRLVTRCCGLPLRDAGDRAGFLGAARALAADLAASARVVVVDPGCAVTLSQDYARLGVAVPPVEPLVDLLVRRLGRLPAGSLAGEDLVYHDPCQLGRGLGRYDEPRAVLARLTGRPPRALVRSREQAECSGGGGLLPLTDPEASVAMADASIAELREARPGTLVTACGGALRRFRSRGEAAVDLVSLVARSWRDACL
jgi:Fe-S oxidoreductase